MILAKDDIEKAVSWWAGKLLDHQPHSNGDDSFTSVTACFLADMAQQDITLDQVNAFKAALTKSIEEYAKSIPVFGFSIGSDYGPCKMLADAADESGIPSRLQCFSLKKKEFGCVMAIVPRLSGFVEVTR